MKIMTPVQEAAFLRALLQTIVDIDAAAGKDKLSVSIDDALEGKLARDWRAALKRAKELLK